MTQLIYPAKIHKRLFDVLRRPVISNFRAPTEKVPEFLDHHLKPVMEKFRSYVKDKQDFFEKLKHLGKVPSHLMLY